MVTIDCRDKAAACNMLLDMATPYEDDSILIFASDEMGISMIETAQIRHLDCFYCDRDAGRMRIAEDMGAHVLHEESLNEDRNAKIGNEGANIIIDLSNRSGLLHRQVAILSQAGRIVIAGKKHGMETYHMRTFSLKEAKLLCVSLS